MPAARGLSQTGRNTAEGACSQQVKRASWRREHELSFDSWSQRAAERIRPSLLPFPGSCPPDLVFALSYVCPTTLQGGSCPFLILEEKTQAQRVYRATQLVPGGALVGAVSLWGAHRPCKGINPCHSLPYIL